MIAIWTPMGLGSLKERTRFIGEQWNQKVADMFLVHLDGRIEQLKKNPRIEPAYKQTEFRQLLINPLAILYYLVEDGFINLIPVWAISKIQTTLRAN